MKILHKLKTLVAPKEYFLVIGAGRSGTSLLAGMLDFHSHLNMTFELGGVDYLQGKKIPENKSQILTARLGSFRQLCQEQAEKRQGYWGNKITTEQIVSLGECTEWPHYLNTFIADVIRKNKVVFILRDGRSCVHSKIRRTGKAYEEALTRYRESVQVLEHFRQCDIDMVEVHYEKLLHMPEAELQRICQHLEVEFQPQMLGGSANEKMIEDYRSPEIRIPEKKEQFPQQWTEDMRYELEVTGYIE